MKNKIIITILCTLMAVGTLTGCGAGKTDSRIVIWTNMSVEVDTLQKYADEWGEKNGYEVEVLHQSPSVQQFAQAVKSGYYGDTVAGMLGIGVLLLLVIYFILCRKYQKRIIELQENAHPGWNWWKLRKQATELEDKKAEGIVEDIRRAAQSYMTV